jgi:GNAT superfamily N-acetyltransferase
MLAGMSPIEVVPFGTEHLDAAATLLAERQARLRAARPELPATFTDPAACRPLLQALLEREGAHGVVGLAKGSPVGYLLGHARLEPIWGRACWSPIEGHALDSALDVEAVRDLYAVWSEHFVRLGFYRHYVHAAADDPDLTAAWFRTGFGAMQAHAVLDLDLPPAMRAWSDGMVVRRAVPDDLELIDDLLPLIGDALVRSPAYAIQTPERHASLRADWAQELAEPEARHWLVQEDGTALAFATFYPADPGPMVPEGACELAVAMTRPEARGRGLMRALLGAGFDEARAAGARHCITDWRTASLPTHRSWTALGFRPSHFRLHRQIDERIAWADGRRA